MSRVNIVRPVSNSRAYIIIHHDKGIDYASGYGDEYIIGITLNKIAAENVVNGFKENGFERRYYKEVDILD